MLSLFLVTGLGAGLLINWLADTLPQGLGATWQNSLRAQPARLRSGRGLGVMAAALLISFYAGWAAGGAHGAGEWLRYFYLQLFLLIAVIDLEHRRVLNSVVGVSALVALAAPLVGHPLSFANALLGGIAGLVSFLLIAMLRPGAMGAGDVKLAGLIGLIAGFPGVWVALAAGILAGGVGAALLVITRQSTRQSTIAYAPYLSLGGSIALIHGGQIVAWYMQRLAV